MPRDKVKDSEKICSEISHSSFLSIWISFQRINSSYQLSIDDLPIQLKLQCSNKGSNGYKLSAATFGSDTHFISALELNDELTSKPGWYIYGGPLKTRKFGDGLQFITSLSQTPNGHRLSCAVYIRA